MKEKERTEVQVTKDVMYFGVWDDGSIQLDTPVDRRVLQAFEQSN